MTLEVILILIQISSGFALPMLTVTRIGRQQPWLLLLAILPIFTVPTIAYFHLESRWTIGVVLLYFAAGLLGFVCSNFIRHRNETSENCPQENGSSGEG